MKNSPSTIDCASLKRLCLFLDKVDALMYAHMEPVHAYGHPDLSGYLPWMGPRYHFPGREAPLSVFRGEGMALFLLAHILQPAVIGECFTGTGYSSMFLAAGCPEAKVLSVDNYSEGSLTGKDAYSEVLRLQASVHLPNMELLYGSTGELNTELQKQPIDLYFSDGPYGNAPRLAPDCVIVRQDDTSGQVPGRTFRILGGSHLSVMSPDEETSEALKREMSKVFPVETLS